MSVSANCMRRLLKQAQRLKSTSSTRKYHYQYAFLLAHKLINPEKTLVTLKKRVVALEAARRRPSLLLQTQQERMNEADLGFLQKQIARRDSKTLSDAILAASRKRLYNARIFASLRRTCPLASVPRKKEKKEMLFRMIKTLNLEYFWNTATPFSTRVKYEDPKRVPLNPLLLQQQQSL